MNLLFLILNTKMFNTFFLNLYIIFKIAIKNIEKFVVNNN